MDKGKLIHFSGGMRGPLSSAAVTNAHHRFVYNVIRVLLKETVL